MLVVKSILLQFFAQRGSVNAQHFRRKRLISIGIIHYGGQQRRLYFAHYQLVDIGGFVAVKILEIGTEGVFSKIA